MRRARQKIGYNRIISPGLLAGIWLESIIEVEATGHLRRVIGFDWFYKGVIIAGTRMRQGRWCVMMIS